MITPLFDFKKLLNHVHPIIPKKNGNGGNIKPPFENENYFSENNDNNLPEIITAADIGNHKIAVFIARLNTDEKIEIIGFAEEKSEGITRGSISNILKVSKCLKAAIDKAAEQAGVIPKSIYASISCAIKTYEHQEVLIRTNSNNTISKKDIATLKARINQSSIYSNEAILYSIPQYFTVDNIEDILNPIGMIGRTLETTFKVITCPSICIKNLERCCSLLDISLNAAYPSVIASAKSVLHNEEMSEGVVLVDIGAKKAGIAVYENNNLLHTEDIPFGGDNITNDICSYTGLFFRNAEDIKTKYGNAIYLNIDNDKTIEAKLFKNVVKTIFLKDLVFVIQCRLTEILELIDYIISLHITKKHILGGVIFTGGTSTIPLFKQLAKAILNIDCFIYSETQSIFTSANPNIKNQLNNPLYTSALGILKLGFKR